IRGKTARRVVERLNTGSPKCIRNQSFCREAFCVLHSRGWTFLRNVHNLFTCALWLPSPAGLRLEISDESDKKKMNFIFNRNEKIFLTKKTTRACRSEKKQTACLENFCRTRTPCI